MAKPKSVPREKVVALAELIREKHDLQVKQAHTQALMIRGCIAAIKQTTDEAQRKLEREHYLAGKKGMIRMTAPMQKVREDKALAFLHLEWLATQLEDVR